MSQLESDSERPVVQSSTQQWQSKKRKKEILDDGTQTFFWRAHTITVLLILITVLVYESLFREQVQDSTYNIKRHVKRIRK